MRTDVKKTNARNFRVAALAIIWLCMAGQSYSATNEWTGAGDTDLWHDPANWSEGVPVAGQDVRIDAPDARTVIKNWFLKVLTRGYTPGATTEKQKYLS